MNLLSVLQRVAVIVVAAWLSHAIGKLLAPNHAWGFALIGGTIAAIGFIFVAFYPSDSHKSDLIGTVIKVLGVLGAGFFLADHPWLWLAIAAVNIPLYIFSARAMFKSKHTFLEAIGAMDDGIGMTQQEQLNRFGPELSGLLYLAGCAALVTAQYKAIYYFFLN